MSGQLIKSRTDLAIPRTALVVRDDPNLPALILRWRPPTQRRLLIRIAVMLAVAEFAVLFVSAVLHEPMTRMQMALAVLVVLAIGWKQTRWIMTLAIAVMLGGAPIIAHAQIAVDSLTADFNAVKDLAGQAKSYALQAQQYVTQGQQLLQLVQQYNAFVQNPSLGAAAGILQTTGLGNDLPINPASLSGLTSGYSMSLANLAGKLAMLSSLSNASFEQRHVFTCTDQSFACQQEQQRAYALAGTSGIAQSAYTDLRNHMAAIQALRDQAATVRDPAGREQVALALQSEIAWNNNLAAQIQAAQMQAKTDEASLMQQDNEKTSQAIEQTLAAIPRGQ